MSDRECPCGMSFPYPSQLKRHQNGKLGCIPYLQSLNTHNCSYNDDIEKEVKRLNDFLCEHCNKKFSTKFNLERHYDVCKKLLDINKKISSNEMEQFYNGLNNILKNNKYDFATLDLDINGKALIKLQTNINHTNTSLNINNNTSKKIQSNKNIIQNANNNSKSSTLELGLINRNINIPEFEFDEVNNRIIPYSTTTSNSNNTISNAISNANQHCPINNGSNGSIVSTSNTSNSIVNSNNITNNITNNINEQVPFVYPFGYENISFLSEEELLEILKSSNGANLVLEKIYSNIENNNFMKMNKKDKTMEYIESPNTIKTCNEKEFIKKMYEHSKNLLLRVFFLCYKKLSEQNKIVVWNNIQRVNDTLDIQTKNMDMEFSNLITNRSNNTLRKEKFKEVKREIEHNNNNVIAKTKEVMEKTKEQQKLLNEDLTKKNISIENIKTNIWNPEINSDDMDIDDYRNNLYNNHLESTPRYNLIKKLEKAELKYALSNILTMGDIDDLYKYRQNRINTEIETMATKFTEMPEHYVENINYLLVKNPVMENRKVLVNVKLENTVAVR